MEYDLLRHLLKPNVLEPNVSLNTKSLLNVNVKVGSGDISGINVPKIQPDQKIYSGLGPMLKSELGPGAEARSGPSITNIHFDSTKSNTNKSNTNKSTTNKTENLRRPLDQYFSCPNCPYKTLYKGCLNKHLRRCKGNMFSCQICREKLPRKLDLIWHIQRLHPAAYDSNLLVNFKKNYDKVHHCTMCSYATNRKRDLTRHQNTHNKVNRRAQRRAIHRPVSTHNHQTVHINVLSYIDADKPSFVTKVEKDQSENTVSTAPEDLMKWVSTVIL